LEVRNGMARREKPQRTNEEPKRKAMREGRRQNNTEGKREGKRKKMRIPKDLIWKT
jgi:hypothetical protein